jgi:hypothetical protein
MAWRIFLKHPISIIFYFLYFLVFISSVNQEIKYKEILNANGGEWPYAHREWTGVALFLFAIIFLFVLIINVAVTHKSFYWWLMAAIVIPVMTYLNLFG